MTLPSDWSIYMSEIVKHSRDGKAAVYSAIQELETFGYLKRKRKRDKDGRFENIVYIVYEEPTDADDDEPLSENREMEKPEMEKRKIENQPLLTTNLLPKTNLKNTELTNCKDSNMKQEDDSDSQNEHIVSESEFVNLIKGLFGDEYPFDKDFEADVFKRLSNSNIEIIHIEDYLKYVFERAKGEKVKKSFDGLYRTLALASNIARDFKNSSYGNDFGGKKTERLIKYVECPICSTRFDELESYCPTCSVSVQEIKNPTLPSYIVRLKYFGMSAEEKQKYDTAYAEREFQIKNQCRRSFLTDSEKLQFWKEYGLID